MTEARALGVGVGRLRSSDLVRPFRGVRMPPATVVQLSDLCSAYSHRLLAGQFFSHETAARMWLAPLEQYFSPSQGLHVTSQRPTRAPRSRGVHGHQCADPKLVVVDRFGFPVADAASTWLQLAATNGVSLDELIIVGDHLVLVPEFVNPADRRPFVTLDELRMRVAGYSGRGARRAREAIEHVRTGSESRRETQLRLAILRAGLPEPELNQVIYSKAGVRIGRADKVYRRYKLIVEYDGQQHRTDSVQYDLDMTRTEEFIRADWFPLKIRTQQMRNGAAEATHRIERALRERGWTP